MIQVGLGAVSGGQVHELVRFGSVGGHQGLLEGLLGFAQLDAVLRTLRTGNGRHHGGQVEFQVLRVLRLEARIVPQALFLGVSLHQSATLLVTSGQAQVVHGDLVNREDGCGRTEFGRHIADGGAVSQRHLRHALAIELHKLADHAVLAQHLGDGEHHVRSGSGGGDGALEFEADHARNQHRHRLTEHRGLGFDTADAPAQHAQTVDHRGVGVGADAGVGVSLHCAVRQFLGEHGTRQVLDVDLVDNAGPRRHHAEVVKGALAPTQELVTFRVAFVFLIRVEFQSVRASEVVNLDRVVDDHFCRSQGVDFLGIPAQVFHGFAHGGQINHAGHAGEVLHHHASRGELDFCAGLRIGIPCRQSLNLVGSDVGTVLVTQQVFAQNAQRVRKLF